MAMPEAPPGFVPEPVAAPEPPAGFIPEPPAGFIPEPPAGFIPESTASAAPAATAAPPAPQNAPLPGSPERRALFPALSTSNETPFQPAGAGQALREAGQEVAQSARNLPSDLSHAQDAVASEDWSAFHGLAANLGRAGIKGGRAVGLPMDWAEPHAAQSATEAAQAGQAAAQSLEQIQNPAVKFAAQQGVGLGIPAAAMAVGGLPAGLGVAAGIGGSDPERPITHATLNAAAMLLPGGKFLAGYPQAALTGAGLDAADQISESLGKGNSVAESVRGIDFTRAGKSGAMMMLMHGAFKMLHAVFGGKVPPEVQQQLEQAKTPQDVEATVNQARGAMPAEPPVGTTNGPQPAVERPIVPVQPPGPVGPPPTPSRPLGTGAPTAEATQQAPPSPIAGQGLPSEQASRTAGPQQSGETGEVPVQSPETNAAAPAAPTAQASAPAAGGQERAGQAVQQPSQVTLPKPPGPTRTPSPSPAAASKALYHVTFPEHVDSIRRDGFVASATGELGSGVYLTETPKQVTGPKYSGKQTQSLPVSINDAIPFLEVKDGPNRPLNVLRTALGVEAGVEKWKELSDTGKAFVNGKPNWSVIHAIVQQQGYGGIRMNGEGAEPKNVIVFDPTRLSVSADTSASDSLSPPPAQAHPPSAPASSDDFLSQQQIDELKIEPDVGEQDLRVEPDTKGNESTAPPPAPAPRFSSRAVAETPIAEMSSRELYDYIGERRLAIDKLGKKWSKSRRQWVLPKLAQEESSRLTGEIVRAEPYLTRALKKLPTLEQIREPQPGEVLPDSYKPKKSEGSGTGSFAPRDAAPARAVNKGYISSAMVSEGAVAQRGETPPTHTTRVVESPSPDAVKRFGDGAVKLKEFIRTVPEFALDPKFTVVGENVPRRVLTEGHQEAHDDRMLQFQDGGRYKFQPEAIGVALSDDLKAGDTVGIDVEAAKKSKQGTVLLAEKASGPPAPGKPPLIAENALADAQAKWKRGEDVTQELGTLSQGHKKATEKPVEDSDLPSREPTNAPTAEDPSGRVVSKEELDALLKEEPVIPPKQGKKKPPRKGAVNIGFLGNFFHGLREIRDQLTADYLPKHQRNAPETIESAFSHAGARAAVVPMIDDFLARVAPDDYHDESKLHPLIDWLNKNDIVGGVDAFMDRSGKARAKAQQAAKDILAARKTYKNLTTNPPAGVVGPALGKLKRAALQSLQKAKDLRTSSLREASATLKAAQRIGKVHDIHAIDSELQAGMNDPKLRPMIDNWKKEVQPELDRLFNEYRRMDPATPRQGRGRYLDTRINLLTEKKAMEMAAVLKDPSASFPAPRASSYRNPDIAFDPTQLAAKFTGKYSTDPRLVMANVLGRRYVEVTKQRYIDSMVKSGIAVEDTSTFPPKRGQPRFIPSKEIQGQPAKRLPILMGESGKDTSARQQRAIWVRGDMVGEIRRAIGTDLPSTPSALNRAVTRLQLLQAADAISHGANLLTSVSAMQGAGKPWQDVLRQIPGVGTADAGTRIAAEWHDIASDSPRARADKARLAKMGVLRPEPQPGGLTGKTGELIHDADTASRIILMRMHDNLVKRGDATPESLRDAVLQAGQYNKRLMSEKQAAFSQSMFSPFIVAGRTFNRLSKRTLLGTPSFGTPNAAAAIQARMIGVAGTLMAGTLPMIGNYVTTGSVFGRSGTPIGAWDTGKDDEKGQHKTIDVFQWTGRRRAMRITGMDALTQGLREGKTPSQMAVQAGGDAAQGALRPWIGPGAQFAATAVTGRRADINAPLEAHKVDDPLVQRAEYVRAALAKTNPPLYALVRPLFTKMGMDTPPEGSGIEDFAKKGLLGSLQRVAGVRAVKPGQSGAQEMAHDFSRARFGEGMTVADESKMQRNAGLVQQVRANAKAGQEELDKRVAAGELSTRDAHLIVRKAGYSGLKWDLQGLPADEAVKVWKSATPAERSDIGQVMIDKIARSDPESMTSADRTKALADLPADLSPDWKKLSAAQAVGYLEALPASRRKNAAGFVHRKLNNVEPKTRSEMEQFRDLRRRFAAAVQTTPAPVLLPSP